MASDDTKNPEDGAPEGAEATEAAERAEAAAKRAEQAAHDAKLADKVAQDVADEATYQAEHTDDRGVTGQASASDSDAQSTHELADRARRSARAAREAAERARKAAADGRVGEARGAADEAEEAATEAEALAEESRQHTAAARRHELAAERAALGATKHEETGPLEPEMIEKRPALYLAEFESSAAVLHAAEKVRDAGFKKWDVHTPFPVHGMDKAMGLGQSHLGWICFVMGLTGLLGGFAMMYWMNGIDYPLIIGGKPPEAVPSMIPIMFECTILLTGFGAVFGMLGLNKLPQHHHPIFYSERFERCSDDRFFISVEAADPSFDLEDTKALLESLHPTHLELIEEEVP